MSSLQEKINLELKEAMKAKNELKLVTMRMLKSDIQYELTKTGASSLSDEAILSLLKVNYNKRLEAAKEYQKANRQDLADKEEFEAKIIQEFMPAEITEEEILKQIREVVPSLNPQSKKEIGKVTGKVMGFFKGKNINGSKVSELIRQELSHLPD